jgi:hypothetical protein
MKATFERTADTTIAKVQGIYAQRGDGYGDTWALENTTAAVTKSTLQRFGITGLKPDEIRLLLLAALIDVKDSRLMGKWNADSLIDGIAYRAAYTTLRDEYESGVSTSTSSALPNADNLDLDTRAPADKV